MVHLLNRLLQIVVILLTKLIDTVLSIETLTDHFVCLHELVDLASKFIVLVADDSDMVVHGVDLDLEVSIVFKKGAVGVPGSLKLLTHVQKLVFLLSDFDL